MIASNVLVTRMHPRLATHAALTRAEEAHRGRSFSPTAMVHALYPAFRMQKAAYSGRPPRFRRLAVCAARRSAPTRHMHQAHPQHEANTSTAASTMRMASVYEGRLDTDSTTPDDSTMVPVLRACTMPPSWWCCTAGLRKLSRATRLIRW